MNLKQSVDSWCKNTISELGKNYNRLGLKASGQWQKDLESKTEISESRINVKILGSRYTGVLVDGRKPNKKQDKDSIRAFVGWAGNTWLKDWVGRKGIVANPFAIAYKIGTEGIKVPNPNNPGTLLSDVFTKDRINLLLKNISDVMKVDIKGKLVKGLK